MPEAPEALTGVSLLRRALPGVEEFIVAWQKDNLTPSCGFFRRLSPGSSFSGLEAPGNSCQHTTENSNGGFGAQTCEDLFFFKLQCP